MIGLDYPDSRMLSQNANEIIVWLMNAERIVSYTAEVPRGRRGDSAPDHGPNPGIRWVPYMRIPSTSSKFYYGSGRHTEHRVVHAHVIRTDIERRITRRQRLETRSDHRAIAVQICHVTSLCAPTHHA